MKFYQGFSYLLITIITNVLLGISAYYVIPFVVGIFTNSLLINIILILLMVVIINPIISFKLVEKIPYKIKGLIDTSDSELDLE